ncbi:hypothetical protein [Aporhodopirellula aestuarii]|uniref:Secreted protein n=1 Tax=Aporhodopirellula aestuarii TaxID=2950107 RepID=A0ABT0U013_9BACT|nr:hypothetical protein [Aporhodopirellula aestuarii]MCM2370076.1 hypothetical protein [Aporhodopirellula aestuarii]
MSDVVTVIELLLPSPAIRRFLRIAIVAGVLIVGSLVITPTGVIGQESVPQQSDSTGAPATSTDPDAEVTGPELVLSAVLRSAEDAAQFERNAAQVRPSLAYRSDTPIHGEIVCRSEDETPLPENHWAPCSLVVTSVADRRVIERAPLIRADEVMVQQDETESAINHSGRWEFRFSQSLPEGVYELRLDTHSPAASRWRGLLYLDRGLLKNRSDANSAAVTPESWPLIVLPAQTQPMPVASVGNAAAVDVPAVSASDSPAQAVTHRRSLVRWNGFPEIDVEYGAFQPGGSLTSRFSWGLAAAERNGASPSQRWASIMETIQQRLDTIVAASADGIVFDATDDSLTGDERELRELLMRCVRAKANRLGLQSWQIVPRESSPAEVNATAADEVILELVKSPASAPSKKTRLRVANFQRPSPQTIRGHFPPALHAADKAEILWFGCRECSIDETSREATTTAELANDPTALPLLRRDEAFAANTWLQDWSKWTIRHTASMSLKRIYRHDLLIDESLLNGEVLPQSGSVRGAIQLWRSCWDEDSRWLTSSQADDERGGSSSLVHIRHANIGDGSVLICVNRAPWPMRVTFPLSEITAWSSQPPTAIDGVRTTLPIVRSGGATIVVPASSLSVCCASDRISPTIQFASEADDARSRIALLTSQVTSIVENLGLLGELAGMTSTARSPAQTMVAGSRYSRGGVNAQNVSTPGASTSDETVSSRAGSLWLTDRWSMGRAFTSGDSRSSSRERTVSSDGTALDQLGERTPPTPVQSLEANQPTCRNLLVNGGFEQRHELGIPGWMHAHHPADAVAIDSVAFSEGRKSIRMCGKTESGASSWLISREVGRPVAGRIGISMSVRGQAPIISDPATSAQPVPPEMAEIRVAIEGERNGQPIRRSETLKVASDGKWHVGRLVLEWLDVDCEKDQNLRVTIDNFSSTTVWIDDVIVTDYFASAAERSELQSLAYLAVQGLQHSDLKPAAALLRNYWANDLLRISHHTTVSMVPDDATGRDGVRSRFPFDVGGLPTPMWREAAPTVPSTENPSPVPPFGSPERTPANDSTVTPEPDPSSDATKIESEASETIAGRLRRWLPNPLRF